MKVKQIIFGLLLATAVLYFIDKFISSNKRFLDQPEFLLGIFLAVFFIFFGVYKIIRN